MTLGTFLHATPLLNNSFFEDAVVYIAEINESGALGFVINKLFGRKFNELQEFKTSPPIALYDGGPVDREHIYFIHNRPELITGGTLICENVYLGGDFKTAVTLINDNTITEHHIRLFIGYCGWDDNELKAEIEEGSWEVKGKGGLFSSLSGLVV